MLIYFLHVTGWKRFKFQTLLPRRRIQILISTNGRNEGLLGVARRRRQEGLKRARFRGTPSETPRHAEESLAVRPLRF